MAQKVDDPPVDFYLIYSPDTGENFAADFQHALIQHRLPEGYKSQTHDPSTKAPDAKYKDYRDRPTDPRAVAEEGTLFQFFLIQA